MTDTIYNEEMIISRIPWDLFKQLEHSCKFKMHVEEELVSVGFSFEIRFFSANEIKWCHITNDTRKLIMSKLEKPFLAKNRTYWKSGIREILKHETTISDNEFWEKTLSE